MSNSKIKSDVQFCCSAQRRKAFLGVGSTKITEVWKYPFFSKVVIPAVIYKGMDRDVESYQNSAL